MFFIVEFIVIIFLIMLGGVVINIAAEVLQFF